MYFLYRIIIILFASKKIYSINNIFIDTSYFEANITINKIIRLAIYK